MPTKAEQERVSRFFHRHEVEFAPEWFGTDSYRQFSNLWQKFAALVNKQNLKILEKIDPLSFEPEEEILYKKIEGEIDERKQDLQQPLFWDEIRNVRNQYEDINEDPTTHAGALADLKKEHKIYRMRICDIYGVDIWNLALTCEAELDEVRSNVKRGKDPSIRRCQAFETSQTAACHKFFKFNRQPGAKRKFCSDRCKDRIAQHKKEKKKKKVIRRSNGNEKKCFRH